MDVSEFIKVGNLVFNLAHIISVDVRINGAVYLTTTADSSADTVVHLFHDEEADALRFQFGRCSTDILAVYQQDVRYRKIAACVHEFPSDPAQSGEVCTKCHEDFADIYG